MGIIEEASFSHIPVASVVGPTNNTYFMGYPGSNLGIWRAEVYRQGGDLYTQKQTFKDPATGKNYNIIGWGGTDQYGNPIPILQDPNSSSGGMFYGRRNPTTGEYAGVENVPMGIGGQVYMPGFGGGGGTTTTPATSSTTTPPANQKPQGMTLTPTAIAIGAAIAVGALAFVAVKKGWVKIPKMR